MDIHSKSKERKIATDCLSIAIHQQSSNLLMLLIIISYKAARVVSSLFLHQNNIVDF